MNIHLAYRLNDDNLLNDLVAHDSSYIFVFIALTPKLIRSLLQRHLGFRWVSSAVPGVTIIRLELSYA